MMLVGSIAWVDLGAFVLLALATTIIATHVVGLATWLRDRDDDERQRGGL